MSHRPGTRGNRLRRLNLIEGYRCCNAWNEGLPCSSGATILPSSMGGALFAVGAAWRCVCSRREIQRDELRARAVVDQARSAL
jgi:hypothetical protein